MPTNNLPGKGSVKARLQHPKSTPQFGYAKLQPHSNRLRYGIENPSKINKHPTSSIRHCTAAIKEAQLQNTAKLQYFVDTERLSLRTLSVEDAEFYLSLVNDASFIKNIRDKGIRTIEQAQQAITTGHQDIQEKLGFSLYLVERKSDQAKLGLCGLVKRDNLPGVDIGYAFLPDFWRQGFAEEACRGILDWAKNGLNFKELYAIVSPSNLASANLLKKLGFQLQEQLNWEDGPVQLFRLNFVLN
ncbi:GNAT family N-acetyltransferase [Undibacterium cyanobacteriorum]|uniref:GNAT family N-acetyltransferase n=1 Tax=Undibacterium cyanobacteriorum TaxID=3073561 RepID=A0ABY9RE93_9BURK|nr:GNAT family N-acetyltransferase [Undibacterium sp. 20NA77.5]WMW79174.1 GNAT family N-acetyltransferase [Undibacterium sp. 20NA77.5]